MKCGYKAWHIFVDLATLMWLGAFVLSFAGPDYWWTSFVLEGVGGVFVVELGVIFFCAATWRAFLKTAWLDILLLIPFLRVFRIGRVARLFRLRRAARFLKSRRYLCALACAEVFEHSIEALDLAQKLYERSSRATRLFRS